MAFLASMGTGAAGVSSIPKAAQGAAGEDVMMKLGGQGPNPLKDFLMMKNSLNSIGIGGKGIPSMPALSSPSGGTNIFARQQPNMNNTLQLIRRLSGGG